MTNLDPYVGLPRPIPALPTARGIVASGTPSTPSAGSSVVPNRGVGRGWAATNTRPSGLPVAEPSDSLRAHVAAGMRAGLDGRQLREQVVAATVHEELGPGVPAAVLRQTTQVVLADPRLRAQLEAAIARERSATRRG